MFLPVFVCLSVCLSICLLARLLKNACMDLDIFQCVRILNYDHLSGIECVR